MGKIIMRHIWPEKLLIAVGTLGFIVGIILSVSGYAAEPSQIKSEVLMQSDSSWDGTPYQSYPNGAPQTTVLKITIPPHTIMPWHSHPMPNAAYVLSGELTVEKKETGQTKVLTAGQVLPEMVGGLHRGVTGDQGVVLIVFYAGTKGMPLSQH
jgi:quercetin dioxygenase-like cupin family protein